MGIGDQNLHLQLQTGQSRRHCDERGRERKKIHERIKIPHTTLTKRRVLPRAYGGTINEKNYYWRKGLRTKKDTTIAWEKKVHQSEEQGIGIVRQNAKCGMAEFGNRQSQEMDNGERNETTPKSKATQGMRWSGIEDGTSEA